MTNPYLSRLPLALLSITMAVVVVSGAPSTSSSLPTVNKIRGGIAFSLEATTEMDLEDVKSSAWPEMQTSDIAMALRYTAEVNRRLQVATAISDHRRRHQRHMPSDELTVRGGCMPETDTSFMSSPRPFRIPMYRTNYNEMNGLSRFHAPVTISPSHRGIERWGPLLEAFLRDLEKSFNLSSLEWSLTMLYLDRACSLEGSESRSTQPLPFCSPRTVHRLIATALLLALSVIREDGISCPSQHQLSLNNQWKHKINALIQSNTKEDWETRVQAMRNAIQDDVFVTPEQMEEFKNVWEARFL